MPRAAVDEIVARGSRLLGSLIAIVVDPRNWAEPLPDWWAPVHATFILAAIPDPTCDAPLLSVMRDAEAHGNDWIGGAMPAILGTRGARLRATLMRILDDRTEPAGVRCTALDGLAATTLVDPEGRDEVFERIGDLFTTTTEHAWVREHAGQVLLDFQVRAYEDALLEFAGEAEERHGLVARGRATGAGTCAPMTRQDLSSDPPTDLDGLVGVHDSLGHGMPCLSSTFDDCTFELECQQW